MNTYTTLRNGLIAVFFVIVPLVGYDIQHTTPQVKAVAPVESPVPSPEPTTSPIPTDIVGYINYKFGEDSWKAFLLLKGNEKCQGENPKLDPKAICDNTLWGGKGQDRGYWQISNYYHPHISDSCASDVKCSTDYVFKMYTNDNNTFRRWTAGRCLGI